MTEVEQVTGPEAHHGEGPVWARWSADDVGLRYVDMLAGDILALDQQSGRVRRAQVGKVAAAFRPRAEGGMVVALERHFALVSQDGAVETLDEVWSDATVRFNDGGTDPDGRFYCGTMAYDSRPGAGSMYLLDVDRTHRRLWGDVTISNGMAWSPAGDAVYYIDTPTNRVDVFDYSAEGGIDVASRRTVVEIASEFGSPDGMTVDANGGLWVALWGGSAVHHYELDGTLADMVPLPVTQVTACTFGGADLDELYITTSRAGLPDDAQPEAGSVFRVRPGVRGLPAATYKG